MTRKEKLAIALAIILIIIILLLILLFQPPPPGGDERRTVLLPQFLTSIINNGTRMPFKVVAPTPERYIEEVMEGRYDAYVVPAGSGRLIRLYPKVEREVFADPICTCGFNSSNLSLGSIFETRNRAERSVLIDPISAAALERYIPIREAVRSGIIEITWHPSCPAIQLASMMKKGQCGSVAHIKWIVVSSDKEFADKVAETLTSRAISTGWLDGVNVGNSPFIEVSLSEAKEIFSYMSVQP